jgi:hypothetical protein
MAMTNGRAQTQDVEGVVEAVNPKGLKLGGAWLNVSQFHPVELPASGAHVRLRVDSKGYIHELEVLEKSQSIGDRLESDTPHCNPRDERITRLAVLKAAANFVGLWGQTREDVRSEHVLMLADKWLAWINQE